jgi:hypothetical protein
MTDPTQLAPLQPFYIGTWLVWPDHVEVQGARIPLSGTTWRTNTSSVWQTKTPTWAYACAFVLILCTMFLSLLFLLVKERAVDGPVMVELVMPSGQAVSQMVYVNSSSTLSQLEGAVRHAQSWSLALTQR